MLQQDIARLWPDWEAVRIIGRGNFGAVYEIRRDTFGHTESAALKVITIPQNESEIDDLYSDGHTTESITMRFQGYLEDIVREYNLMVDMKGHPNVVYCDDLRFVQHEDGIGWNIYIKMELLTPLMKRFSGPAPEEEVIRLGRDICSALVLCKEMKIVHRDIKPQNIFVSRTGQYKLGDFGIAKTAERTTSGTKIGTYKYMAPEVYHNRPYGAGADIYSLGLVLYWLLNDRRTPFQPLDHIPTASEEEEARKRRFAGEPIPSPARGSEALKAIVLKACAYDPKERFASAEEMLAAFAALQGQSMPAFTPIRPADTPAPVPVAEKNQNPTVIPAQSAAPVAAKVPVPAQEPEEELVPAELVAPETAEETIPEDAPYVTVCFRANDRIVQETRYTVGEEVTPPDISSQAPYRHHFACWEPELMNTALVDAEYTAVFQRMSETPAEVAAKKGRKRAMAVPRSKIVAAVSVLTISLAIMFLPRVRFAMLSAGDHTVTWDRWEDTELFGPNYLNNKVLQKDGTVKLSDDCVWTQITMLSVSYYHTAGLRADGTVVAWGNNVYNQCVVSGWRNVAAITCGDTYTAGLTKDGQILVAGKLP